MQLLRYMVQLWGEELASGRYASEGRVLPFIIPVIFYHGSKKWNGKPLRELFEDSPYKVCVPTFEMIVSDISAISDTALWENAEDNAMLLLLKALLSKDTIDIIAHVFLFLTIRRHSNPFNTIPIFLNYIRITNSEITKELIAQRMKEIAMQQGYDIDIDMDLEKGAAEFWFPDYISRKVAESKAEGRAEGRAEEVENAKNTLLVLMEDRFVSIPSEIRTYIGNISNSSRIHSLTRSVLKAKTIQDFALLLRERQ